MIQTDNDNKTDMKLSVLNKKNKKIVKTNNDSGNVLH